MGPLAPYGLLNLGTGGPPTPPPPGSAAGIFFGGFPAVLNLAGAVAPLPASLLGAIKSYWNANGLNLSIGPFYAEGVPGSTQTPFVVVDRIEEVLPGVTPDDKPVELWMTVWHKSAAQARTAARLIEDHFGDPSEVPAAIQRERLTWTVGSENFAERDDSFPSRSPRKHVGSAYAYLHRIHYRFWIRGRA